MLLTNSSSEIISDENRLNEIFFTGCKTEESIGVESEKILVYNSDNKAVKYEDTVKILECFTAQKWQKIYEDGNLIGLKGDDGVITLEPGSQIEISLKPFKSIDEISKKLENFYNLLSIYAEKVNAKVLDIGIQPVSTYEDIKIIPKKRYEFMTKYLPVKNLTPYVMMRETAGIQANFDYKSEQDAVRKLSLALKMSPVISSVYSNSPVRGGKNTGYKSFRANSWLNVDEERCGLVSSRLFEKELNFSFTDYTQLLLDIPMIFIKRGEEYYYADITFREFLKNGYKNLTPLIEDWQNHISLYFPDVRLKTYIEIRNHDAQNPEMTFSVPAFWKGIMYNEDALSECENILADYTYEDFVKLRKEAPLYGINAKLNNTLVSDLVKEFFDISYCTLKENYSGEEKYLDIVFEYINMKKVPSDFYSGNLK